MSSAACARTIEGCLLAEEGVVSASAALPSTTVKVGWLPAQANLRGYMEPRADWDWYSVGRQNPDPPLRPTCSRLIEKLGDAGFAATLQSSSSTGAVAEDRAAQARAMRQDLIWCVLFTIPIVVLNLVLPRTGGVEAEHIEHQVRQCRRRDRCRRRRRMPPHTTTAHHRRLQAASWPRHADV